MLPAAAPARPTVAESATDSSWDAVASGSFGSTSESRVRIGEPRLMIAAASSNFALLAFQHLPAYVLPSPDAAINSAFA